MATRFTKSNAMGFTTAIFFLLCSMPAVIAQTTAGDA
jgi:hypothetical protein